MVDSVIGPYRIVRLLGEGGMGAVYEAVNDSIERRVAIKVLHSDYANKADVVARFFNEARAINRIAHPSIVQVHEQGRLPDGTAYIVMEYLEGQTLSQRLKEGEGRLPHKAAIQIAWQVAAALAAAHAKDIVHRDMNPSNLMLIPDPFGPGGERVKVLDFGIAKLFADVRDRKTASHLIMGTPTYMSPEQCHGADVVDDKTDVYSVGAILFEMLAGRPPFVGEGAGELVGMHLFQPTPSLSELAPDVQPELVAFTEQLLSKNKAQRPTMQEASVRLSQLASMDAAMSSPGLRVPTGAIPAVLARNLSPSAATPRALESSPLLQKEPEPASVGGRRWARLLGAGLAGAAVAGGLLFLLRTIAVHQPAQSASRVDAADSEPPSVVATTTESTPTPKKPPPRAFRPLSVKLPPLRTASDLPIVIAQKSPLPVTPTVKPGALAAADVDNILSNAQREYLTRNYAKAIELAKTVQQESPIRAWRIVGSSACGLKDLKVLKEAYAKLDGAGRQYLYFVCQRNGINLESAIGATKP